MIMEAFLKTVWIQLTLWFSPLRNLIRCALHVECYTWSASCCLYIQLIVFRFPLSVFRSPFLFRLQASHEYCRFLFRYFHVKYASKLRLIYSTSLVSPHAIRRQDIFFEPKYRAWKNKSPYRSYQIFHAPRTSVSAQNLFPSRREIRWWYLLWY